MVEETGPEIGWRSFIFPKVSQLEYRSRRYGLDVKLFQNGPVLYSALWGAGIF